MKNVHLVFFALLLLLFTACQPEVTHDLVIQTPFEQVEQVSEQVEIDPLQDNLVRLKNGTSLEVPKGAFVDGAGKLVTNPVQLTYKQFTNAAEIITSGIPMNYKDEEGNEEQLESAGMFELTGMANGTTVHIAQDKNIQVNMNSSIEGDYDFFYLEPDAKANRKVAQIASTDTPTQYRWKKLSKPTEVIAKKHFSPLDSFQLQFDTANYPELADISTFNWLLASTDSFKNPNSISQAWAKQEKWSSISISQPKYESRLLKEIPINGDYAYLINSPDSSLVVFMDDQQLRITDWNGTVLKTINQLEHSDRYPAQFSETGKLLLIYREKGVLLLTKTLKTVLDDEVYFIGMDETKQRVAYIERKNKELTNQLRIIDFNGQLQHSIDLSAYGLNQEDYNFDMQDGKLLVRIQDKCIIYSLEGKRQANFTIPILAIDKKGSKYARFLDNKTHVGVHTDHDVFIWDWSKDIYYSFQEQTGITTRSFPNYHPEKPIALLSHYNDKNCYIWNWKTSSVNQFKLAKNYYYGASFLGKNFIQERSSSSFIIRDLQGTIIDKTPIAQTDRRYRNTVSILKNDTRLLITSKEKNRLTDPKGTLIRDFTAFDPETEWALMADSSHVITSSKDGMTRFWDLEGKLLNSINLNTKNSIIMTYGNNPPNDLFTALDLASYGTTVKRWARNGTLLNDYIGQLRSISFYHAAQKFYLINQYNKQKVRLYQDEIRAIHPNIYQLNLSKGEKHYCSMVYLTEAQYAIIQGYLKIKDQRINQELDRQEEEQKVIRSFAINNFGIYNWDRFYKQENSIRCAANFQIEGATDFNNITVFLITGENRNAVIQYPKSNWSTFSFIPDQYNQLLAVLPNNKIAVCSPEDFAKLDLEAIRKSKKVNITLKASETIKSVEDLNKVLM